MHQWLDPPGITPGIAYTSLVLSSRRQLSVLLRRARSQADCRRVLREFEEWRALQNLLPVPQRGRDRLLIVRLDDIGDYVLFRNQLGVFKQSARWRGHHLTLLGNASWKSLFTRLDAGTVDETVWVDKNRYLQVADYRMEVWRDLRTRGFDATIAPSRTRPLLLDDLCVLAAAPSHSLASTNTHVHPAWNRVSDALYGDLFAGERTALHEFRFNADFAAWSCGLQYPGTRPWIERPGTAPAGEAYIVCFIGANTRSKRWPEERWIEFIQQYRRRHRARVVLAGASPDEVEAGLRIQRATDAASIAGTVSLPELLTWIAAADAVVSNDTMAAHLAVSCNRPTVIVANGVNYSRFTEYGRAGIAGVATVYPEVFRRQRLRRGEIRYDYSSAISADIASIVPTLVLQALEETMATHAAVEPAR